MSKANWKDFDDEKSSEKSLNGVKRPKNFKSKKRNKFKKRKQNQSHDSESFNEFFSKLSSTVCGLNLNTKKSRSRSPTRHSIDSKMSTVKQQVKKIRNSRDQDLDWLLDSDYFTSSDENIYEEVKETPPPKEFRKSVRLKKKAKKNSFIKSDVLDSICSLRCLKKKPKPRPPSRQELDEKIISVQKQARLSAQRYSKPDMETESEEDDYEEIDLKSLKSSQKVYPKKPPPLPPKRSITARSKDKPSFSSLKSSKSNQTSATFLGSYSGPAKLEFLNQVNMVSAKKDKLSSPKKTSSLPLFQSQSKNDKG